MICIHTMKLISKYTHHLLYKQKFSKYQNIEFQLNYIYDSRNIYNDPTNGLLFNISLIYALGINKSQSFSNIFIESKKFTKIFEKREITFINKIK